MNRLIPKRLSPSGPTILLAVLVIIPFGAGCVSRASNRVSGEFPSTLRYRDVSVRVEVPLDELVSIGTYRISAINRTGEPQRIVGQRDGSLQKVWLVDLGRDGALDLVVWCVSAGSGSYGTAHWYVWRDGEVAKAAIPPLSTEQREGYGGHDTFAVKQGRLLRSFPVYSAADSNAMPSGGIRELVFDPTEGSWATAR